MSFENKVVIVTGSSSGIGATISQYFANLSAKVVIVGRNEEKLKEVAKQIEKAKGIKPLVVKANVDQDSDMKRLVTETIKEFGQIDVLVNNAGTLVNAGIRDGIEPFDEVISTNLRSVYFLTYLVVPYLINTKGNIVNISSVLSVKVPKIKLLPYAISKAGLDMFTRCTAKELAEHGIRVNSVNPGAVKTNILNSFQMNNLEEEIYYENKAKEAVLGKIATSDDVAELVIFLASEKANSITGCIHFIDNGKLLA